MKASAASRAEPDRRAALKQYEQRSGTYDLELAAFEPIRGLAIDRLGLLPGQTVLDIGCGTGLSLERLQKDLGPRGRIVGIEQCPEMIARARRRLTPQTRGQIELICAPVEDADPDVAADAALFHFTHDILRRPEAIERVMQHLKPGARIVATGLQWAPPWALPVNLFVWGAAMRSVSSLAGLSVPWNLLAERTADCQVQSLLFGSVFLAEARRR